ncbi:MAG: hypothetical protein ACT4P6_11850 [Gemmatimonadaceae bacterium]
MNRRGIALLLVLLAMLVTAAMVAGVLVVTSTQARAGGDAQQSLRVAEAAERGHILAAARWSPESTVTTPDGSTIGPIVNTYVDSTTSRAWITRLSRGSFWVTAIGRDLIAGGSLPIERRLGVLYGLSVPELHLTAALSLRDSLLVTAAATVDGTDMVPPGWTSVCPTTTAAVAAVATPDTTRISGPASLLNGSPAKLQDSTAALSVLLGQFGPVTWSSLVAHATHVLPISQTVSPMPSLTGAACDTTAANNWGDPTRTTACRNRFVIVHAHGDVAINAGMGQGIILGEGDVELRNGAQFVGVILARDDIVALTGASRVWGAVLAADARRGNGDLSVIAGAAAITYSACSVEMALLGTAPMRRESHRGWIPLH